MHIDSSTIQNPNSLDSTYHAMDKEGNSGKASNDQGLTETKAGGSTREENPDPIIVSILADSIQEDTLELNKTILALAGKLKNYTELSFDQIKLTPEAEEPLLALLQKQSNLFTTNVKNRTM
jgi:hypothetical protein